MIERATHAARHEEAALFLLEARLAGRPGPRIPEHCRPTDLEAAWMIHNTVTTQFALRVGGWKCGLPKPGRFSVAPIYVPWLTLLSTVAMPIVGNQARIEPEIGFVLGRDLPARGAPYDHDTVMAAIGSTHLALELVASRYERPEEASFPELFADCLQNHGLLIGPEISSPPPATLPITIESRDAILQALDGAHPDANPAAPLPWLANELGRRGIDLSAGQVIITGSFAGIVSVPIDTDLRIRFGTLGTIAVRFVRQ